MRNIAYRVGNKLAQQSLSVYAVSASSRSVLVRTGIETLTLGPSLGTLVYLEVSDTVLGAAD